jgi:hypothetical protein
MVQTAGTVATAVAPSPIPDPAIPDDSAASRAHDERFMSLDSAGAATDTSRLADYRDLNDTALLRECRWEVFRGSGPGGQKRDKTSSAVRLTHVPTGISVVAGESRSQSENRMRAVRRLRLRLATELRRPVDLRGYAPPDWLDQFRQPPAKGSTSGARILHIAERNPLHASAVGALLDLLAATGGSVADVAALWAVSTSSVVRFLHEEPSAWAAANRIRVAAGQLPLTSPR